MKKLLFTISLLLLLLLPLTSAVTEHLWLNPSGTPPPFDSSTSGTTAEFNFLTNADITITGLEIFLVETPTNSWSVSVTDLSNSTVIYSQSLNGGANHSVSINLLSGRTYRFSIPNIPGTPCNIGGFPTISSTNLDFISVTGDACSGGEGGATILDGIYYELTSAPVDPCLNVSTPGANTVISGNCNVTDITPQVANSVLDCQGYTITNTVANGGLVHTVGNNLELRNCNVVSMVGSNTLAGGYDGARITFQNSNLTTNRAVENYGGNQIFTFNNSVLDFTGAPGYANCGGSVNILNSVVTNFGSSDWCGSAFNVFDSNLTYSGSGGPPLGGASTAIMRRNRFLFTGTYTDITGYWGGSFTFEDNYFDNQGQIGTYNASAEDVQDVVAYTTTGFGGGNPFIVRNNVFVGNPFYGNLFCIGGTPSVLSQITGNDIQLEVKDSNGGECTGPVMLGANVSNNNYTYMPRFWTVRPGGNLDLTGKIFELTYTSLPYGVATENTFPIYGWLNKVKDDVNFLVEFDTPIQFTGQTAYDFLKAGKRTVYINSSVVVPGSGRITFANTEINGLSNLTILKDGVTCTTCSDITVGSVKRWWLGSTNRTMNATTVSFVTTNLAGNYTVLQTPPCIPGYQCTEFVCQPGNIFACVSVIDVNSCGEPLPANTTFNSVCVYPIPPPPPENVTPPPPVVPPSAPSQPPQTIIIVTSSGTPNVTINETTNETIVTPPDVSNVTDLRIESSTTTIDFSGQGINLTQLVNLTSFVTITTNSVTIDSVNMPALNVPAVLTFTDVGSDYVIYKNGVVCTESECSNVNYNWFTGILTFDVTGFSTYSVGTAAAAGCQDVKTTVFAAFALIAVSIIITVAFLLIKFGEGPGAYMAAAVTTIGLAIVLFVGYVVISSVQYAICLA